MTPDPLSRIRTLFEKTGGEFYGEDVTQLEHAIQCATLARNGGGAPAFILAAFLHDVGHLLELEGAESMGEYGTESHERLGADFLKELAPISDGVVLLSLGLHDKMTEFLDLIER